METPLEIVFHNVDPSESVKAPIRKHVDKLGRLYGRLIRCRVSIENRRQRQRAGNFYEVHIEMQAPRGHLVVSREPHHAKERFARPNDLLMAMHDAFKAAEAQLSSFGDRQNGAVKRHASPPSAEL